VPAKAGIPNRLVCMAQKAKPLQEISSCNGFVIFLAKKL